MIEHKEFDTWLDNPVTKEVFKILRENREAIINELRLIPSSDRKNATLLMGHCSGAIGVFDDILNITYGDISEEEVENV